MSDRTKKTLFVGGIVATAIGVLLLVPASDIRLASDSTRCRPAPHSSAVEARVNALPMIFLHHSCGGQMLAPVGPDVGESCVYESHPNGGNLRSMLTNLGYVVHEASYDSIVGGHTDMFDYLPKFRNQMERVLRTLRQDEELPSGQRNRIVVFKSCFTESEFVGEGSGDGDPRGPDLTVANAKATLRAMLPEFARHPDTLFVYVTAPPLSPNLPPEALWKRLVKTVRAGTSLALQHRERGRLARMFNNWVVAENGWLSGYSGNNVVVFNYYDVLTGHGCSNFLEYVNRDDIYDSHPSREGNEVAAREFVTTLQAAVAQHAPREP